MMLSSIHFGFEFSCWSETMSSIECTCDAFQVSISCHFIGCICFMQICHPEEPRVSAFAYVPLFDFNWTMVLCACWQLPKPSTGKLWQRVFWDWNSRNCEVWSSHPDNMKWHCWKHKWNAPRHKPLAIHDPMGNGQQSVSAYVQMLNQIFVSVWILFYVRT